MAEEARYGIIFALRTNARVALLNAVLGQCNLLTVESLFQTAKAIRHARPIFHSSDAVVRGPHRVWVWYGKRKLLK